MNVGITYEQTVRSEALYLHVLFSTTGSSTDEEEINSVFSSEDQTDGNIWQLDGARPKLQQYFLPEFSSSAISEPTDAIELTEIG